MLTSFYLSHNQDILPQWHNISILLYSLTFINAFSLRYTHIGFSISQKENGKEIIMLSAGNGSKIYC